MSKQFRNIKGTFDIVPDPSVTGDASEFSSAEWFRVEQTIRLVMNRFAMSEIRTPIIEPLELIARGVGELTDIVSKEMFVISRDRADYVLRPEVTAPVVRAYLQHNLSQSSPVQQLFYIGPCFRAERPQKGRYRQFHQFGAEIIGDAGPMADVEVIKCMAAVYEELGITNVQLKINSLGSETSRPAYKKALAEYLTEFEDRLSETSKARLQHNVLRILDTKNPDERALLANAPSLVDYIDDESKAHFDTVCELLTQLGMRFEIDPFLVRGLDYYTRTAFELESPDLGAQSALAGGGRYDLLARDLGSKKDVPAVGFAAGIERLLIAIKEISEAPSVVSGPDFYIAPLNEEALIWSATAADRLRKAGASVACAFSTRSLKSLLKDADRKNAQVAVIVGESEMANRTATIRDLATGDQQSVAFNNLTSIVNQQK